MSVVRGMRGVGGVCGMCLARVGVDGEGGKWMRGLVLGFTNPVGTRGVFRLRWWGVSRGFGPGSGGVGWCYICVSWEFRFAVYMTGPGICLYAWRMDIYRVFVYDRYHKPVCL